jgi:hypothetical protein
MTNARADRCPGVRRFCRVAARVRPRQSALKKYVVEQGVPSGISA